MISPSPKNNENYNKTRIHTRGDGDVSITYTILHSYIYMCVCVCVCVFVYMYHLLIYYVWFFFSFNRYTCVKGIPITAYSIWRDRARIAYSVNDNRWSLTGSSSWGTTLGPLSACINNSIHLRRVRRVLLKVRLRRITAAACRTTARTLSHSNR